MDNWERLVRAALKHQHRAPSAAASSAAGIGLASAVPPSLGKTTNIEHILQAADDIEDDDPNVARIRNLLYPRVSAALLFTTCCCC